MKQMDPDYKGFRGHDQEPTRKAPLEAVVCSVCQRKKQVPVGVALEHQGKAYVCVSCQEKG